MTDPLFPQLVNQHLFEEIVKSQYEICASEQRPAKQVLSKDEENVIRYACGYVSMRLLCKFKETRLQVLWNVYHIWQLKGQRSHF